MRAVDPSSFEPDTYIAAVPHQVSSDAGGETVILNLETGQYHGLESVGSRAWGLLAEGTTVARIHAVLCQEFDVDADTCRDDLMHLLRDLAERGLVEVRDAPAS